MSGWLPASRTWTGQYVPARPAPRCNARAAWISPVGFRRCQACAWKLGTEGLRAMPEGERDGQRCDEPARERAR